MCIVDTYAYFCCMDVKKMLTGFGFDALNSMQEQMLSVAKEKQDIILLSPTGTGKSLAFLLPLLSNASAICPLPIAIDGAGKGFQIWRFLPVL